ncbi:MAG TPA: aminoglycoside adenylyltransferase domain-containing protein [Dehalococcoidia bacterium]|nr:aminoglycoside adenylyltransferase domain-containing protein [Dehalococcoidia bacterium]
MPLQASHPTPYAEVNALLARLLVELRETLGGQLAGVYLRGSLASGDFDPASSDVDVLVVTESKLGEAAIAALAAMHARLAASGLAWAPHLECSHVPRAAVRRYDPARARFPEIGVDKPYGVRQHGVDWVIELSIVREHGVALAGPPPQELIDPVAPEELRAAVCALLGGWWTEMLGQAGWFRERRYQAFAVLSMCRALYTLEYGAIVSKPEAAAWARTALGEEWAPLIDRALAWRSDSTEADPAEALAFVRLAIARSRAGTV